MRHRSSQSPSPSPSPSPSLSLSPSLPLTQVRHRSSDRFARNMLSIGSSGINSALSKVSSR